MSQEEKKRVIQAYLDGEESPEGKHLFEQWYASFSDETPNTAQPGSGTAERLWQRIAQHTHQTGEPVSDSPETRVVALASRRHYGWAAAAVILLVSVASAIWYRTVAPPDPLPAVAYVERVNAAGQRSVVRLPDGSVVYLNAGSRLRFPRSFAGKEREVWLTGEAFFTIRRNSKQPFTVRTGSLRTTVLGTSFDVRAYPAEPQIEVAVVTGKVRVADAQTSVLLTPDRVATYRPETGTLLAASVRSARDRASWTTGRLVFEKQKLSRIITVLNRHYNVDIRLADGRLADYELNADFDNEPLTRVLELLCGYLKTTYKRAGNDIVVGRETVPHDR